MIPDRLKKGDTIGVIAPSDPVMADKLEDINKSILLMENAGFKIEFGKYVFSNELGYGAKPEHKAFDIHNMFQKKEIKAIFCAIGGENSNSVFDFLDYDIIKNNPKIICGFSDSTSLLNVVNLKTGLVTFHGPTFKSLTSWETDYGYKEVIKQFVDGNTSFGANEDIYTTIQEGIAEGELVGGNLTMVKGMTCGKYALDFENKILFIEELGYEAEPTLVSNSLYYLKQNGVFDKIKGLWVGNYEHDSGISLEKIVLDVIGDKYSFPIIKSNNFGHTDKKVVIPIGVKAKIDTAKDRKIWLIDKCVK